MKFLEVPKYNEDGSVEGMVLISPEEAKDLLKFAINFLASFGASTMAQFGAKMDELQSLENMEFTKTND